MEIFDFKNISKDNIYIGNIYIVEDIDKTYKKEYVYPDDYISNLNKIYKTCLAKKETILIKVNDIYYVDIDSIKDLQDCDYINFCLKNNITDNILLKESLLNSCVGKLFVGDLKRFENIKTNDIKILKLLNEK